MRARSTLNWLQSNNVSCTLMTALIHRSQLSKLNRNDKKRKLCQLSVIHVGITTLQLLIFMLE